MEHDETNDLLQLERGWKGTAGKGYNWNGFRKIEKFAGNRQKITFFTPLFTNFSEGLSRH